MCLATMAYICVHAVRVTIFSTGSKFRLVSNFTELHVLTQVAHPYVLLLKTHRDAVGILPDS